MMTVRISQVALISSGPLSGKSELSKYLEKNHGYIRADHSMTLVRSYCNWMNQTGGSLTPAQVYADKENHRQALQQHGYAIGFNDPAATGYWIELTLQEWKRSPYGTPVVFDSIRGPEQARYMRDINFTVVQLVIGEAERERRAKDLGLDYQKIRINMAADPGLEMGINNPDITLPAFYPLEDLARMLTAKLRAL